MGFLRPSRSDADDQTIEDIESLKRPAAIELKSGLKIDPPLLQAPMAGITTLGMRTLSEEQGCGLTISEWIPASAMASGRASAISKIRASENDHPYGIQIFGRKPDEIKRAAAIVAEKGAHLLDINMGCPGKRVRSGATGAALMREPELAAEILLAAIEGVNDRCAVSVKMRAGWDDSDLNAPRLASDLSRLGAQMITVHGRTRQQRYQGRVNLDIIREVKEAIDVPLIANGDIVDFHSMIKTFKYTKADGVMIGRAALGNPWLFAELASLWRDDQPGKDLERFIPTKADRLKMYLRHLDLNLPTFEDPEEGVRTMRKFAAWYLQGLDENKDIRQAINRELNVNKIHTLVKEMIAAEENI